MTNSELRELYDRVMSIEADRRAMRGSPYEPSTLVYEDRASETKYIQFINGSYLNMNLEQTAIDRVPVFMHGNFATNDKPLNLDKTIMTDIDKMLNGL